MSKMFNGVKVFSATMVADRDKLGDKVGDWIREKQASSTGFELTQLPLVTQSSDEAFHCIAITVFYWEPNAGRVADHAYVSAGDTPAASGDRP